MDIRSSILSISNRVFLFRGFLFNKGEGAGKVLSLFGSVNQAELFKKLGNQSGDPDKWVWEALKDRETEGLLDTIRAAEDEIHNDLYPIVKRVLLGKAECVSHANDKSVFVGIPPLRMRSGLLEKNFLLPLEDAAIRRLKEQAPEYSSARYIPFKIGEARVYLIGTGVGILVWDIQFLNPFQKDKNANIPIEVICEGTTIMSRAYEKRANLLSVKLEQRKATTDLVVGQSVGLDNNYELSAEVSNLSSPKLGFMLTDCAQGKTGLVAFPHALGSHPIREWMDAMLPTNYSVGSSKTNPRGQPHERLFSYAAVQLPKAATTAEAEMVSYRLAHKYTSDYEMSEQGFYETVIKPFKNIVHTMATQGGAVVVVDNGTEFVNQFVNLAVKTTYLPLTLLSYHEYICLRALNEADLHPKSLGHYDEELEENLVRFQKEIMEFRLHYRFCHISDLSNQNRVFQHWRKTLKLDEMLRELSEDAAESERVLNILREQRQKKDRTLFNWVSVFAIFVLFSHMAEVYTHLFVLPPVKIAPVLEKASELLNKVSRTTEYAETVVEFQRQVKVVVEGLHSMHHWEEGFFAVACVLVLIALRFLLRHRKSPIGGE